MLATDDPLRRSLTIAVPLAANVGGIGTPVGTPPNAIALGYLADAGIDASFLDWMLLAVPLAALLLFVAWFALGRIYPAQTDSVTLEFDGVFDQSRSARFFYAVFGLTVVLWMLEPLHGVPSTVVGFLPVVVLLATGVFGVDDLRAVQWHVLWLVGGASRWGRACRQRGSTPG